jgi:transposase-like protein
MLHQIPINCPNCPSQDIVKNGHRSNGDQRWRCNKCKKSFQLSYRYNANKQGIAEQIEELTLNSSGVRDIARTLSINKNTVVNHLKKKRQ